MGEVRTASVTPRPAHGESTLRRDSPTQSLASPRVWGNSLPRTTSAPRVATIKASGTNCRSRMGHRAACRRFTVGITSMGTQFWWPAKDMGLLPEFRKYWAKREDGDTALDVAKKMQKDRAGYEIIVAYGTGDAFPRGD